MAQVPATAIGKAMACCLLVLLVFFSRHSQVEGQAAECDSARNCSECLDVAVQCQWCSDELDYWEGRRCQASFASTRPCTNIITFESSVSITMNEAFSNEVQVRPQLVKANLRSQESIQFNATVNPSRNYPLDVYYLMDHSFSMRDDLDKMKQFASGISSAIDSLTSNYRLGYGSFVDKPRMPFVVTDEQNIITPCLGCKLPYAFQNSLKLGNDSSLFNLTINADTISGNWDTPEGTFDALIQAAVCKDIGWRTNSRRVLLIATDAASHTAGEGRLLGINRPNDGLCHLDSKGFFTDFGSYDFPSISFTAYIFQRERILPIFMTTKYIQSWYSLAANQMRATGARVVQLDDDSANVIQLLSAELERLVRVARMIVLTQSGVNISVVATCPDGNQSTTDPTTGFQQCTNLGFGKMATFSITLTGLKCSNLRGLKSVVVRFVGYGDITVDITPLCQCPCEQAPVINSTFCASQGSSACGVCNCNSGFRDKTNTSRCDCNMNNNSPCVELGTSTGVCNGRGECVCQECQCLPPANALISNAAYSGQYCECDNFNCPIASTGAICGGSTQGRCVCGKCQCLGGFTGRDCSCPLSTATCMRSDSLCSGVGNCSCGQCQCTAGYGGDFCEEYSNIETFSRSAVEGNTTRHRSTKALSIVTYVGCGISMAPLLCTIVTILMFKSLRNSHHQHLVLGLSVTLLLLLAIFISTIWAASNKQACQAVGIVMHYLLLCAFLWMSAEASFLYNQTVTIFGGAAHLFLKKLVCAVFVIPLVIVGISAGATQLKAYSTNSYCWISDIRVFYGVFVAPMALTLIYNLAILTSVVLQLHKRNKVHANIQANRQRGGPVYLLRFVVGLSVLLGITWTVGLLVVIFDHIILHWLFTVLNVSQGALIFLFHTARPQDVRKEWSEWLCRWRPKTAGAGSKGKGAGAKAPNKKTDKKNKKKGGNSKPGFELVGPSHSGRVAGQAGSSTAVTVSGGAESSAPSTQDTLATGITRETSFSLSNTRRRSTRRSVTTPWSSGMHNSSAGPYDAGATSTEAETEFNDVSVDVDFTTTDKAGLI